MGDGLARAIYLGETKALWIPWPAPRTGGIRRGLALGFGVEIGVAALYPMPPVVRIAFERGDGEESGR